MARPRHLLPLRLLRTRNQPPKPTACLRASTVPAEFLKLGDRDCSQKDGKAGGPTCALGGGHSCRGRTVAVGMFSATAISAPVSVAATIGQTRSGPHRNQTLLPSADPEAQHCAQPKANRADGGSGEKGGNLGKCYFCYRKLEIRKMDRKRAELLSAEIAHFVSESIIDIKQLDSKEWESMSFQYIGKDEYGLNEPDIISMFDIKHDDSIYRIAIMNWSGRRPGDYYLIIYDKNKGMKILCQMYKYNDGHLNWKYSPRKRDIDNQARKKRFSEMYGSTEVHVPLPSSIVSAYEFLSNILTLANVRKKAHGLENTNYVDNSFPEGKHIERLHKFRERSSRVVDDAKKQHANKHNGKLPCEVCGFDFSATYGDRGKHFIEAHHKVPLRELRKGDSVETKVEDLAMVCSNCHRMLHRSPSLTVEELKKRMGA